MWVQRLLLNVAFTVNVKIHFLPAAGSIEVPLIKECKGWSTLGPPGTCGGDLEIFSHRIIYVLGKSQQTEKSTSECLSHLR